MIEKYPVKEWEQRLMYLVKVKEKPYMRGFPCYSENSLNKRIALCERKGYHYTVIKYVREEG